MKKTVCLIVAFIFIILSFTSCSKAEIKETSDAGAFCLMFREFVENEVDISRYRYLSFDKDSCGLEGEELEYLENYIKEYCEKAEVEYMDCSLVELRRAFMINPGMYGEEFTHGYLLTFAPIYPMELNGEITHYSSEINFWHGDMNGIGGCEFYLMKTDDGWYIDRDNSNGGYSLILQ